jgi:hypothetical protein
MVTEKNRKRIMRYARSEIDVIGRIWMPAVTAATTLTAGAYDIANMHDAGTPGRPPVISRESVASWLDCHAGDFQSVDDFRASLETGAPETLTIDWRSEDSEEVFAGCMWPDDSEDSEWLG